MVRTDSYRPRQHMQRGSLLWPNQREFNSFSVTLPGGFARRVQFLALSQVRIGPRRMAYMGKMGKGGGPSDPPRAGTGRPSALGVPQFGPLFCRTLTRLHGETSHPSGSATKGVGGVLVHDPRGKPGEGGTVGFKALLERSPPEQRTTTIPSIPLSKPRPISNPWGTQSIRGAPV